MAAWWQPTQRCQNGSNVQQTAWWSRFFTGLGFVAAILLFNAILLGIVERSVQPTVERAPEYDPSRAISFKKYTIRTFKNDVTAIQYLARNASDAIFWPRHSVLFC